MPISGERMSLSWTVLSTRLATLDFVLKHYHVRGLSSLRTGLLLDKHSRRTVSVSIDYRGFEIPDRFVVGYGMDFNDQYWNLPYIVKLLSLFLLDISRNISRLVICNKYVKLISSTLILTSYLGYGKPYR
jgi:hypothetical protein